MSDPPAARRGDKTDHDDTVLLVGPGAANTKFNGKAAWRAVVDIKGCNVLTPTPHGAEIAQYGSYTVLIEDNMAIRVGDHLLGSPSPAEITEGSPNVFIGDKAFGLATRNAAFCKDFCEMMESWDSMTPDEREQALQDVTNKHLEELGVPKIGVGFEAMSGSKNGSFSFKNWKLKLNSKYGGTLTEAEQSRLAQTLIHEGRHAEQWWHASQYSAAQEGATASGLRATMKIPEDVANEAIANPLNGLFGKTVYNSVYGTNRAYRQETFRLNKIRPRPAGAYDRYRTLPEEHDAWAMAESRKCVCADEKAKASP